jgi:hypothetical protein
MNSATLQQLSQQADALQQSLDALMDPDKAPATIQRAVFNAQVKQQMRRARNKADNTLKSGQYAYIPREYGKVRISDSGAVYIAAGVGWRRVKGKAALDVKQMVARADAKAAVIMPRLQAALEGRAA